GRAHLRLVRRGPRRVAGAAPGAESGGGAIDGVPDLLRRAFAVAADGSGAALVSRCRARGPAGAGRGIASRLARHIATRAVAVAARRSAVALDREAVPRGAGR